MSRTPWPIAALVLLVALVGCGGRDGRPTQGYIEADYVYPAAPNAGRLVERPHARGDAIHAGDLLGVLDPDPERLQVAQLEAATERLQLEAERRHAMLTNGVIPRSEFDDSRLNLAQQERELDESRWRESQKRIVAPFEGRVHDTYFEPGDWVPAGRPLLALLPADRLKVRFYLSAAELESVTVGATVRVTASEAQPAVEASVAFISDRPEYTPPVIYSRDRHDKLVFLVEARLAPTNAANFHPGEPVEIQLDDGTAN